MDDSYGDRSIMGSLKFPHTSGNSMSIAAPATNPASDLELKLPATIGTANQVLKNSGTAGTLEFGSGGKLLNWVTAESTAVAEITTATITDVNLSASITPSAASSRILVMWTALTVLKRSTNQFWASLMLCDGSNNILQGYTDDYGGNQIGMEASGGGATNVVLAQRKTWTFIHHPNTTSSFTYKMRAQISTSGGNSPAFYWHRDVNGNTHRVGHIHLLELA